jgi:hypothetical protein
MSLPGYREDLFSACDDPVPGRRRRTRPRLPGGSARCTRASRRWVEARTVVRNVGRRPGVHRRKGARAADVGLQAESSARNRVVGRGHPGKRATGLGVLEVERRTASGGWLPWSRISVRSGAGLRLSRRRRAGPTGTSSARSSGTWIVAPARGIHGPDRTADHRGPGPGRWGLRTRSPAGASRWPGSVQAVRSVLRRGRPLLHEGPAASTVVRPEPDDGESAPQRGKTLWAGSGGSGSAGCWASRAARRGGRPPACRPDGRAHPRPGTRQRRPRPTVRSAGGGRAAAPAGPGSARRVGRSDERKGARPGTHPSDRHPRGPPGG